MQQKSGDFMITDTGRGINPQATPILLNNRPIGRVENGVFHKTIKTVHMLRTPKALCFDRSTLRDAEAAGAVSARVYNTETRTAYTASLARIRAEGFAVNRGFGDQWALVLDAWSVDGQRPRVDIQAAQTNAEVKELQLGLFGEGA